MKQVIPIGMLWKLALLLVTIIKQYATFRQSGGVTNSFCERENTLQIFLYVYVKTTRYIVQIFQFCDCIMKHFIQDSMFENMGFSSRCTHFPLVIFGNWIEFRIFFPLLWLQYGIVL